MNAAQEMTELNAEATEFDLPSLYEEDDYEDEDEKDEGEYWQWLEKRQCFVRWDRHRHEFVYSDSEAEKSLGDMIWLIEKVER